MDFCLRRDTRPEILANGFRMWSKMTNFAHLLFITDNYD